MRRVKSIVRVSEAERRANNDRLRSYTRGDEKWAQIEGIVEAVEAEWQLPELTPASADPVLARAGERYDGEKADSALSRQRWARELRADIFRRNGVGICQGDAAQVDPRYWMTIANRERMLAA